MRRIQLLVLTSLLVLLVITACAPKPAASPTVATPAPAVAPAPAAPAAQAPAKKSWEEEWEKLVAAAKQEGKVIIYTAGGQETRRVLGERFKERFGINTEWVGGRGPELSEKIMMERRARLHMADVLIGASQPALMTLKPAGALDPLEPVLILPEVTDPKGWFLGKFPWLDKDHYIVSFVAYPDTTCIFNTEQVKPEELRSFRDLLHPKWKRKMVMDDPTFPGMGGAFFIAVEKVMGLDYLRELAKQEPVLTRDRRQLVEWVAYGKYPLGLAPHTHPVAEFQMAGAPIEVGRPVEGGWLSSGSGLVSLLNKAPHPNASRVFINWILTKEAQLAHTKASLQASFRDDIPMDYLPAVRRRDPNVKYFILVTEEYCLNYDANMKKAQEIFGPLKK